MADIYKDFAYATLTSGVTAVATSIPIDQTSRLPTNAELSANQFWMTFESTLAAGTFEIVQVTAKSTTSGPGNLTVVRGQQGTTAVAQSTGTVIKAAITAAMLTNLRLTPASSVVSGTSFGAASAVGTSLNYARQDHAHGTPATPVTSLSGTAGMITASASTGAVTLAFPSQMTIPGNMEFTAGNGILLRTTGPVDDASIYGDTAGHSVIRVGPNGHYWYANDGSTLIGVLSNAGNLETVGSIYTYGNPIHLGVQNGLAYGSGGIGRMTLNAGYTGSSGYVGFYDPFAVRQGYIGNSTTSMAADTGVIEYVAGGHSVTGTLYTNANLIARNGTSSQITLGNSDQATGAWWRNDGSNSVLSTKAGSMYYGYNGAAGLNHNWQVNGSNTTVMQLQTTGTLLLPSLNPATLSSTDHPLQIGPTNGLNAAYTNAEIQARNNGAVANFYINQDGGNVILGSTASDITLGGRLVSGWTSYSPTTTGLTSGAASGKYKWVSPNLVFVQVSITAGTVTTAGTASTVTLPVTADSFMTQAVAGQFNNNVLHHGRITGGTAVLAMSPTNNAGTNLSVGTSMVNVRYSFIYGAA